jgi:antitoxin HigA-1
VRHRGIDVENDLKTAVVSRTNGHILVTQLFLPIHSGLLRTAESTGNEVGTVARHGVAERSRNMTRMHEPPHPGEVLKEYLGDKTVTETAVRLGVSRVTLSRIVSGASGVSIDMAFRLGQVFGTTPELWAGMQLQYDLHQADSRRRR